MQGQTNAKIGKKAKLYDTRILETQEAEKGWAYACSDNYRSFSSSTLPTLYTDINTKLQNGVEGTDIYMIDNLSTNNYDYNLTNLGLQNIDDLYVNFLKCDNNYYTSGYNDSYGIGLYIYNNNSWVQIQNSPNIMYAITDSIGSSIVGIDDGSRIYKFNPQNNTFIKLADESVFDYPGSGGNNTSASYKEFNNNFYLYPNYRSSGVDPISNHIYEIPTDPTSSVFTDYAFNKKIIDVVYSNNYWYVLVNKLNEYDYDIGFEVYKGLSLSNNDFSDTTKWELMYSTTTNNMNHALYITVINNRFVVFYSNSYIYSDDEFNTVNIVANIFSGYEEILVMNNVIIMCDSANLVKYCKISKIDNANNWQTQTIGDTIYIFTPPINNNIYLIAGTNDVLEAYSLNVSSLGQSFPINYYKYGNFKICQFSDLTLLNELYSLYGVSNYWNIYNNTISIPVDCQEYKIMYVGDNFQDTLYVDDSENSNEEE
ncbi:MAG: hypothetical protein IJ880_00230 [Bacilli bacterium]|nr:hypothetical protein [Bacilli bacterium]